jgi:thioredoxin-related protein
MKRPRLTAAVIFGIIGIGAVLTWQFGFTDGSSKGAVKWVAFDEGMAKAQIENKKVLVDVYTDWCTWCKKMDAEVYKDPKVAEILKEKFITIKLNAEANASLKYANNSYTNAEFTKSLGIDGYPATVFFSSDSKPITLLPGYVEPQRFASILRYIGEDHYKSVPFEDYLNKGTQVK